MSGCSLISVTLAPAYVNYTVEINAAAVTAVGHVTGE
jgi:hypothetical protein